MGFNSRESKWMLTKWCNLFPSLLLPACLLQNAITSHWVYPDGIPEMPPTCYRAGLNTWQTLQAVGQLRGMPVVCQFCICKSVNVMSVLCGLNTSIALLWGPSWTWTTSQSYRGSESEAAVWGCCAASPPSTPALAPPGGIHRPTWTQEAVCHRLTP